MDGHSFSLRARLTLLLAAAILVAMGGAAMVVDWRADAALQQRFDVSLLSRAESFAALVAVRAGVVSVTAAPETGARFPGAVVAAWHTLRCDGRTVTQTLNVPLPRVDGTEPVYVNAIVDGYRVRAVSLRFNATREGGTGPTPHATTCTLQYALDRSSLDDLLRTIDFILAGSLLSAFGLVLLTVPWLVWRGLRPVATLNRAMAGIGPDAPGRRLPVGGARELAPLVARFNDVLARMDDGLMRERQFASGLAHEFRTRLAELRALVEVETRYPSGRDAAAVLGEVASIGAELEATVTALLQLTRIQSGLEAMQRESLTIGPWVSRVLARHAHLARTRAVDVVVDVTADARVVADPVLLEIVLDNLLGNATAYAPQHTAITVRSTPVMLAVVNAAPALRKADLANFGKRFWRKTSGGSGHAGLGLALAGAAAHELDLPLTFALDRGVLIATLGLIHPDKA